MIGWKKLPAVIFEVDEIKAQLVELYENLKRRKFTALEEGEALAKAKELYEALHPETKNGGDRKSAEFSGNKSDGQNDHLKSFVNETAKKTGQNARTVRRKIKTSQAITPAAKAAIRETPVAESGAELRRLGDLPEEKQEAVAEAIKEGKAETVKEAVKAIEPKAEEPCADVLEKMKRDNAAIEAIARKITGIYGEVEELDNPHIFDTSVAEIFRSNLKQAANTLRAQKGFGVCPYCEGKWCKRCRKTGYLPQVEFESAPKKK
jgi:tRNA U34 5-methylaminomethyl-2-thiouridine-forming methyltransferase MnmC